MTQIVRLFTSESPDDIRSKGGSFAWKLNTAKANLCTYAFLFHNARNRTGARVAEHGDLFCIGRISGLAARPDGRHAILFDAIATPDFSDRWPSNHQNPVNYDEFDEAQLAGLKFEPVEPGPILSSPTSGPPISQGLTIVRAKELLAQHYGVTPDAIEIIIRG